MFLWSFALVAVVLAVFLFRRVLKVLVWLAIAVLVGFGIPGLVLAVLFFVSHLSGIR